MRGITIRMGAAHDSITTPEGETIDLSMMTEADAKRARRITQEILKSNISKQGN